MQFNVIIDGPVAVLDLSGDLAADSADDVAAEVRTLAATYRFIVVDMARVGFMDSYGLRTCMNIHALLAEKGGLVAYAQVNETVGRVFSMTKADRKLLVASSRLAAIRTLKNAHAGREADVDGAGGRVVQIRLGRDFAEIASARTKIREYCEGLFTDPAHRSSLDDFYLAATEAMNNAVEHSGAKDIGVAVGAAGGQLIFKMVTPGARFDPTVKRTMPDLDSAGELPEGGFGLAIIQSLMDSVSYEYVDGNNILTLRKTVYPQKEENNGI